MNCDISLIYSKNNIGSRIDPFGTSYCKSADLENLSLTFT